MPFSKKRKLGTETEARIDEQDKVTELEAPNMSVGENADSGIEQPLSEETPRPDDSATDKNIERQARFKALQARAVSVSS